MSTDTSEKGLESLIVAWMTGQTDGSQVARGTGEPPAAYGGGWILGDTGTTTASRLWT